MKLRIQGNSVRFRLTQSEVQQLANGQPIEERTPTAPQPLIYRITPTDTQNIKAIFSGGVLSVHAPNDELQKWASSTNVGIDGAIATADGDELQILIEKDFKCLHGSPDGQQDCFPNPQATAVEVPREANALHPDAPLPSPALSNTPLQKTE